MNTVCIIPARGGSKRIPRKNIKLFRGKPLLVWSIEKAIKSKCFTDVIVSTDDEEIANLAISSGANVPFLRPKELSDDFVGTLDVVKFVIKNFNKEIKYACCLYATAPMVLINDLVKSYEEIKILKDDSLIFTATNFDYPIQRAFVLNSLNKASMIKKNFLFTRSQDLEKTFHDAGQFYWGKTSNWLKAKNMIDNNKAYFLPRWRVQDIDEEEDWLRAEIIHKILEEKGLT
jgi:N-acylneuraminate cytidylyltransferase